MIDEVKAPNWGAKWCQNQGVAFGPAIPHCTTTEEGAARTPAPRKPLKEEAFSDFPGVYDECRTDGVFCSNAMQIP